MKKFFAKSHVVSLGLVYLLLQLHEPQPVLHRAQRDRFAAT